MATNLLLVSGASRGLGQAIAIAFAEAVTQHHKDIVLWEAALIGRNMQGLHETRTFMQEAAREPSQVKSYEYSVDLGNLSSLENAMEPIFQKHIVRKATTQIPKANSKAILINCAGTTGHIGKNPTSLQAIQETVNLNLTSKTWMTSKFIDLCERSLAFEETTVVNISSMCAVKPTPTMALYCATSAGREMYHQVLAKDLEMNSVPCAETATRILNYAPGSCDTDMQAQLRNHSGLDPNVQSYCQSLVSEGGLVQCEDTAARLVQLVLKNNSKKKESAWNSGDRVEFVDVNTYKY